jgi:L-idonate 5-dehydrogenase
MPPALMATVTWPGPGASVAPDVRGIAVGARVAVNPSRPCRACRYCLDGLPNHCEGPVQHHRERLAQREFLVGDVARHRRALHRVADQLTGSGPIGALAVAVCRHFGAREVTVTDVVPEPLAVARAGAPGPVQHHRERLAQREFLVGDVARHRRALHPAR